MESLKFLEECKLCPRNCKVNRLKRRKTVFAELEKK